MSTNYTFWLTPSVNMPILPDLCQSVYHRPDECHVLHLLRHGCDTISSFRQTGERSVFCLLKQKSARFQGLGSLGSDPLTSDQVIVATCVVEEVYRSSGSALLITLYCVKPDKNSLCKLNRLLYVYQLAIWGEVVEGMVEWPGPLEYGWEKDEEHKYCPQTMSQLPVAPDL